MKSGCVSSAFTDWIAFGSVTLASGFGGPWKPQWVSESCTNMKSSCAAIFGDEVVQPYKPDANTAPPTPASFKKSRRSTFILASLGMNEPREHGQRPRDRGISGPRSRAAPGCAPRGLGTLTAVPAGLFRHAVARSPAGAA